MTEKKTLHTKDAPSPIGAYEQAVIAKGLVFTSGQIPIDQAGNLVGSNVTEQCKQVLRNIEAILKEAKSNFQNVIKTTCYLTDMADFSAFDTVYAQHFSTPCPARSCIAVKALPKNALVEIEVVALANSY